MPRSNKSKSKDNANFNLLEPFIKGFDDPGREKPKLEQVTDTLTGFTKAVQTLELSDDEKKKIDAKIEAEAARNAQALPRLDGKSAG